MLNIVRGYIKKWKLRLRRSTVSDWALARINRMDFDRLWYGAGLGGSRADKKGSTCGRTNCLLEVTLFC